MGSMCSKGKDKAHRNDIVSHTLNETLTSPPLHLVPLPTLPFDLIEEILCRLPVKLLLQLRCLCKSFNSLISDPKFAKKHLRFSTKSHHLMLSSINNLKELILLDSPIPSVFSTSPVVVTYTQLNYPDTLKDYFYTQPSNVCSCNGILCITLFNLSVILWNPSIKKFKILLPPPSLDNPLKRFHVSRTIYSFGYDHFIQNYKIVVSFSKDNKTNEVSVLTLGTDYWRRIQDIPYVGYIDGSGIFVSDTVNWVVNDGSYRAIVSLDLEKESYQKLSVPDLKGYSWTIGLLKDCLCIFENCDMFLDVWVMREYGFQGSWIKLHIVPYIGARVWSGYTNVLYISEDEQMLVDLYDLRSVKFDLGIYNSKNGTLKISEIQNTNRWMEPNVYIESLISPCF